MTAERRDEDAEYNPKHVVQYCNLGNPDDVAVNGQRFAFEDARVSRVYISGDDEYPSSMGAEWDNVMWINPEDEQLALTIPACFLDSAPMGSDRRQPSAVTWADLMERELIEMAEKKGGWY
jgi:hypothetical protein